jgi:hypothetical protein
LLELLEKAKEEKKKIEETIVRLEIELALENSNTGDFFFAKHPMG